MPTNEPVASTMVVAPTTTPQPIPDRVVSTKSVVKPGFASQPITDRSEPVAESTTPEESVKLAPQLSALARKEQAFRQRELVLKQREQDLEAKLANAEKFENLQTKIGAKDFSSAEELGLSYEEYTNYLLNKQAGEDPETQKFKALEEKIQALEKGREESATREYEETVAEYRTEITTMVASNPEFSSIKELGREDAVLQLILDSWEEDGEELTIDQACKDIENFIVEQGKQFTSLTKFKPAEVDERKLPPPKTGPRTLTNNMQPSGETKVAKPSYQKMSESERYQAARAEVLRKRQLQGN